MLPIQLNLVASNSAALLPSSGSMIAEEATMASDRPSGVALP